MAPPAERRPGAHPLVAGRRKAVGMSVLAIALAAPLAVEAHGRSQPGPPTVQWLYERCRTPAGAAWCEGYLTGAADMLGAFGNGGHKAGICGAIYTPAQLRQMFLAWAPKNRAFWPMPMGAGAVGAFKRRWPC